MEAGDERGKPALHVLGMIRFVAAECPGFAYRAGPYETGNDKTALELLAGDPLLLSYLNGGGSREELRRYFVETEREWIDRAAPFLFYEEPLISTGAVVK